MDDDPSFREMLKPLVKDLEELTEVQIQGAITPLVRQIAGLEAMATEQATRVADLEGQVRDLQRVVTDTPATADMEDVDSGEA